MDYHSPFNYQIMAVYIKPIPTLHSSVAERFNKQAEQNFTERKGSIAFSRQVSIAKEILKKAQL